MDMMSNELSLTLTDRGDNSTSTKMEYRNLDDYSDIPFPAKYN